MNHIVTAAKYEKYVFPRKRVNMYSAIGNMSMMYYQFCHVLRITKNHLCKLLNIYLTNKCPTLGSDDGTAEMKNYFMDFFLFVL